MVRWTTLLAVLAMACAAPGQMGPKAEVAHPVAQAPAPAAGHLVSTPLSRPPQPVQANGAIGGRDFASQVQPILEARCRPCHFPGGVVYTRLPFDRAATILELREKLFTRIKNENDRQTIRKFLAQQAGGDPGQGSK
jgi:hypothetical protein